MQVKAGEEDVLSRVAIEDVWGVGRRLAVRLRRVGALDARGFIKLPPSVVRSIGGVTLERTWRELHGTPCLDMEEVVPARKNTCCSRSFGKPLTELVELEEAVANYAVRAIRKVRSEGSLACGIQVFVMTNRFREDQAQYSNARALALDEPTDDPIRVIRRAKELLRAIFRPGYSYKKAGVILLDLVSSHSRQSLLFEEFGDDRTRGFVNAVEEVAARYGPGGGFWAAQGMNRSWRMRREMRTPRYTTNWGEIPDIGEKHK